MFQSRPARRAIRGFALPVRAAWCATFWSRHSTRAEGQERLAAIVSRLDATDPRWRLADLDADRGLLPDDQNSALLVPKLRAALARPDFDPPRPSRKFPDLFADIPPNRHLDDEVVAAIDEAMEGNSLALGIARSFVKYPRGLRSEEHT